MTKLTPEQEKTVTLFEKRLANVDKQIAALEEKRSILLETFDEQYAGYLNHYAAYYDDEPLTMRKYFEASNEWDELFAKWNELNSRDDSTEIDEFEKATDSRFRYLERILGA